MESNLENKFFIFKEDFKMKKSTKFGIGIGLGIAFLAGVKALFDKRNKEDEAALEDVEYEVSDSEESEN